MSVLNAVTMPHPPVLLPEIGRGEERKIAATASACRAAARFVLQAQPDTVVLVSPHAQAYRDWFCISGGEGAQGDFARFGAPGVRMDVRYDAPLANALAEEAGSERFPAGTDGERSRELDHGTMLPLYFLREAGGGALPPIVRVGLSGLPLAEHYRLGMLLARAAGRLGRKICVVGSGDLSHKFLAEGPYGYAPEGPQYDARIMDVLGRGAFGELFDFDEAFCAQAAECGHRSFTILAGCFDGLDVRARALSHEGPFGVGYGVCTFAPLSPSASRRFYAARLAGEAQRLAARRAGEDAWVRLARLSVETFVRTGMAAERPASLPAALTEQRAGVFVSLHLRGQLRGCIGTIAPAARCVADEILHNGVSACSRDPRFPPVEERELPLLEYSVDVLGEPEHVVSERELDAHRYGVIVTRGARRGLLLPDLEGVDTPRQQLAIARQKAGIGADEPVELERFEVTRHV